MVKAVAEVDGGDEEAEAEVDVVDVVQVGKVEEEDHGRRW